MLMITRSIALVMWRQDWACVPPWVFLSSFPLQLLFLLNPAPSIRLWGMPQGMTGVQLTDFSCSVFPFPHCCWLPVVSRQLTCRKDPAKTCYRLMSIYDYWCVTIITLSREWGLLHKLQWWGQSVLLIFVCHYLEDRLCSGLELSFSLFLTLSFITCQTIVLWISHAR